VVGDRLEHEVVGHGVEERPDVDVDHPVAAPAPLPAHPDRVQRGPLRPIAVGVRMEHRFHGRFQIHPDDRLRDPIGHGRHPQNANPRASGLRDLHRFHRRREVATRRQPIPDPIQVLVAILLELGDRLLVDARRALVGLDPLKCFPHHPLGDVERLVLQLRFTHPAPPGHTG
jgi:hypothetical protein